MECLGRIFEALGVPWGLMYLGEFKYMVGVGATQHLLTLFRILYCSIHIGDGKVSRRV